MTDERAAFEELNRRHQVGRAYFFSQKDFRRQFNIRLPIGLCAGLVQVWWAELRKGNDAIRCLKEATPQLIGGVLLSQARSVYLKEFPPLNRGLRAYEVELLKFKYGEQSVSSINDLCKLFDVNNCLELDLTLLHDLPVIKRWQFSHLASDVVNAIEESRRPGLYVLLARYWDSKRPSKERGHRSALFIEAAGSCRFYDPLWGEMSFLNLDQFGGWFTEYWTAQLWDYYLQRGTPPSTPVQLFAFGGAFSPEASEKSMALQERFSASNLNAEELVLWLDNLRTAAVGGPRRDGDAPSQQIGHG
jgi:hypothetical protein